jgi:protein-tyrosine-phosphatase
MPAAVADSRRVFQRSRNPERGHAASAGTVPGECVHTEVQAVMEGLGIDLSSAKPQS